MGSCVPVMRFRDYFSSHAYPVVSIQHGISAPEQLYDKFLRIMLTPHYECDSIVCTSRSCKRAMGNILREVSAAFNHQFGTAIEFGGRLDIVPLCVDTDALRPREKGPLRKQLGIPLDAVVLLYIGYISLMKADLLPLLPMIRRLVDANPSAKVLFVIAGTGPQSYAESLLEFVGDLGLSKNVSLLREVSDVQKEQLLGAADIFVGPSDSMEESFGLTPVEAMACGLPQVVADWDGYRETVSHGETGFLIPTSWGSSDHDVRGMDNLLGSLPDHMLLTQSIVLDLAEMQDRLQQLMRQPELRATMAGRSRARAVAEFSYTAAARHYDELWVELAAIANALQLHPKKRRCDEPAYFDFFGHFASQELTDDCVLHVRNGLPIPRLIRAVQRELPGLRVFDEALLDELIHTLSNSEVSVGELICSQTNGTRSADTIRRHILFLLKHGRVSCVRGRMTELRAVHADLGTRC